MKSQFHDTHDWKLIAFDGPAQDAAVSTCTHCGLLCLKTTSNVFYFTEIGDPFVHCRRALRDDKAPEPATT